MRGVSLLGVGGRVGVLGFYCRFVHSGTGGLGVLLQGFGNCMFYAWKVKERCVFF